MILCQAVVEISPHSAIVTKISEIKQRGDRSQSVIRRGSTGQDLLKFAGTWHGDDLEECLTFLDATGYL
jgi:hypothetical protein